MLFLPLETNHTVFHALKNNVTLGNENITTGNTNIWIFNNMNEGKGIRTENNMTENPGVNSNSV